MMPPYIYSVRPLCDLLNTLDQMRCNRDSDYYNRLLCSLGDLVRSARKEYFHYLESIPDVISSSVSDYSEDELPF